MLAAAIVAAAAGYNVNYKQGPELPPPHCPGQNAVQCPSEQIVPAWPRLRAPGRRVARQRQRVACVLQL